MNVILTHEHADFDAIASLVGLARLVPDSLPVLPQTVNDNVADFLTVFGGLLPLLHRDELPRGTVEHAYFVDTRRAQAVRGMSPDTPISVVDHHMDDTDQPGNLLELDVQPVGATATLMTERLASAGTRPKGVEATLLLLGIYEDTGSFTYGATTARDLRAAAWLLAGGADLRMRERFLRYTLSDAAQALYRSLIDSVETIELGGHAVVFASARSPGFEDEIATIATKMIDYLDPSALLLLVDVGGHVQLVARSLADGVDVGRVAEAVGGGGHPRAAAAVLRGVGLASARTMVLAALPPAVRARSLVSDVMSSGEINTLHPDATVDDALVVVRSVGHEGYPVVEDGELLGVVSRRDLDRALHHQMGRRHVRSLLSGAIPSVAPGDSTESLLKTMLEHDVGQVPVVENGRLVGIATRSDLLRAWSARGQGGSSRERPSVRVELSAALGVIASEAVRRLADCAAQRGERAYLVGGLPRDLVLGIDPGPDIDIVIEGDALAVARAAAETHGGRVTAHSRFGTAKWIHGDVSIDVISARTEYYREPTALPSVSRGSLRSDLRRRDFTINTLAVDLSQDGMGQVIDFYGGLADLALKVVRVLHSLSFVEDPTRILRAVRFATRLGFNIEGRTSELIPEAAHLLSRVSGARLRNELLQLFGEQNPVAALHHLEAFGALDAISTGLRPGRRTQALLEALPGAWQTWREMTAGRALPGRPLPVHALSLWLTALGEPGMHACKRLRLTKRDDLMVHTVVGLVASPGVLARRDARGSEVYHALRAVSEAGLVIAWLVAENETVRDNLVRFGAHLSATRTDVSGEDLAALGVPRGPVYKRVLGAVLDAKLDGAVTSRDEELAWLRRALARDAAQERS